MKITSKSQLFCILAFLCISSNTHAQLLKKLQQKAEQAVERKLEQKVEKETEKKMDTLLNPNQKSSNKTSPQTTPTSNTSIPNTEDGTSETIQNTNISDKLEVYSKYDFVPGDKLLFFDDFSQDFIGDFPSKWNTNASGEVVKFNKVEGNWFEFKPGHRIYFIPDIKSLPEDYTIEFDILTEGLSQKTSSGAKLEIYLSDSGLFETGTNYYAYASLPFGLYSPFDIFMHNYMNGKNTINSYIKADIRKDIQNQPHISISVTKNRFRLSVNQVKYVDIPRF